MQKRSLIKRKKKTNLRKNEKEKDKYMIIKDKEVENKAIVINNKSYYENDLNDNMRNSLIALNTQRTNKARLQIDVTNADILIIHHSKVVDDELAKIKSID